MGVFSFVDFLISTKLGLALSNHPGVCPQLTEQDAG